MGDLTTQGTGVSISEQKQRRRRPVLCRVCNNIKPHYAKELCWSCYYHDRYGHNAEYRRKHKLLGKKWRANNKTYYFDHIKDVMLKRKYGLPIGEYDRLFKLQEGKCKICNRVGLTLNGSIDKKKTHKLVVDHNHDTNDIRGLLCNNCNSGIGFFYDNPDFLRSAIEYLQTANSKELVTING